MAKEESKINVKYGVHGLKKVDDITTLNGTTVEDMPAESKTFLANYGFFVFISRLTANEKNVAKWSTLFAENLKWFMDGMPTVERKTRKLTDDEKTLIEKENTVKTLTAMVATLSKNEAKTLQGTVDKINVDIETLKVKIAADKAKTE